MTVYERDPNKRPAAVVLLTRGPLVLGITCKGQIASLQLPGGKEEPEDRRGADLGHRSARRGETDFRTPFFTAARELQEETGIAVSFAQLGHLVDYVAPTGRFVRAFLVTPQAGREWPERFEPTEAGWPGWVHPHALLTPWCTYREECAIILEAYRERLAEAG